MVIDKEKEVVVGRYIEDNKYFKIAINHYKGAYVVNWYEAKRQGIFEQVEYMNMPKNMTIMLFAKRFSKKDLLKMDAELQAKIENYYGYWNTENYDRLIDRLRLDMATAIKGK